MKKVIEYLSSEIGIKNKGLLEKDIILQILLHNISQNKYLEDNLVFKGGTCLTKCYLGYYRFSEDLDFSWINQEEFKNKSQKEIRRLLSDKINEIGNILENICKKHNFVFKLDKSDSKYVELGGSNKFTTFKVWYKSSLADNEQFVKLQINFLELFNFKFKYLKPHTLIKDINIKEFEFLFPEFSHLLNDFKVHCYDIKEIFCEKFRAILTRRGVKARDFIDIFLMHKREGIDFNKLHNEIIDKTKFMLRYNKYVQNLKDFKLEKFVLGEEEKLLLTPIEDGLEGYLHEIHDFLNRLIHTLK